MRIDIRRSGKLCKLFFGSCWAWWCAMISAWLPRPDLPVLGDTTYAMTWLLIPKGQRGYSGVFPRLQ
jgi:hypothetical protein